MAWGSLAFEGGLSLIQQGSSFIAARNKNKSDKQWQDWRNKIVRLSNAQNQNAITSNARMAFESNALQRKAIEKSRELTYASTEVQAAASGVRGRSVTQTLSQVNNNAADAQSRLAMDLDQKILGFQQQREQSNLQTVQQLEYSPLPKPSGAAELLNFTADVSKLWKTYSPEIKSKL